LGRRQFIAGGLSKTVGTERFNFWKKAAGRQPVAGRWSPTQTVCPKQVKHVHVWLLDQSPCSTAGV